jgi:hypothetical protein
MLSGEATNTNFIVLGLTWSGFEPKIYCTRGEHANHYTTDAFGFNWFQCIMMSWSNLLTVNAFLDVSREMYRSHENCIFYDVYTISFLTRLFYRRQFILLPADPVSKVNWSLIMNWMKKKCPPGSRHIQSNYMLELSCVIFYPDSHSRI